MKFDIADPAAWAVGEHGLRGVALIEDLWL
jgi:hypothetical protein